MTVRAVEGKKPYTGGTAITIDENKVISLNLRDENNLIIYDSGDDEIYVDLQLPDEITPTDAFPVGVTTGRVIVDNGWDANGTIICAKTTSGDNIKILYEDNGTLWMDNGTGTFKQIYFKSDVDGIITTLTTYINGELAKKQNGVTSDTAPSNPSEGDLWYDTVNDALKVYDGTNWVATGTGGSGDVVVSTDTGNELSTGVGLWLGTESDFSSISTPDTNTLYIQYKSDGGGGWQPGVNTLVYLPLKGDAIDQTGNYTFTNSNVTIGSDYATFSGNGRLLSTADFSLTGNNSRTVSAWLNPSSSSLMVGVGRGGTAQGAKFGWYLETYEIAVWGNGGIYDYKPNQTLASNTWSLLTITTDGTDVYVYVNGVQVGTASKTYNTSNGPLSIGSNNTTGQYYFSGNMADVIIEDKARTAQEIADYFDLTKSNYGIS